MKLFYHIGRYALFVRRLFSRPEKPSLYRAEVLREMNSIGIGSLGIVSIISVFIGAVITIQSAYNLTNPFIPIYAVAVITRDSIILEFSPTIICLVLAGKVGSSIASELGTMKVTEQIDALEIMGINSASYLVLPKIIAAVLIIPFVTMVSMFLGILGGWIGGTSSGVITSHDFVRGLLDSFVPFNITFALIKTITFAFAITSVSAYHGYYTSGGALEVGKTSTRAVVYSSTVILILDYLLTQLFLS